MKFTTLLLCPPADPSKFCIAYLPFYSFANSNILKFCTAFCFCFVLYVLQLGFSASDFCKSCNLIFLKEKFFKSTFDCCMEEYSYSLFNYNWLMLHPTDYRWRTSILLSKECKNSPPHVILEQ